MCLVVPALLISASMRPQGAAAATIFLQSSSRDTSPWTTTTSPPAVRQRSAVCSASFWLEEYVMTMLAPSLARMAAVAAPRPDADPVTITHKPSFDIPIFPHGFLDRDVGYHIVE